MNPIQGLKHILFSEYSLLIAVILASLFWGFCTGFGVPARNVYLMDISPKHLYPFLLSLYQTVADIGFVLGLESEAADFNERCTLRRGCSWRRRRRFW